ncbi:MAG: cytochrome c nitrite reductase small subunit [Gammaproteobacteria bacterium]|nr:cytochrome c nitrite reductase small subunit [Gammaproteobacteria bacterium]
MTRHTSQNGKSLVILLLVTCLGIGLGIAGYTLLYAKGLSYLSTDPRACANCHIMQSQYDSWQKSSHHNVADCVDCHLPHGVIGKYLAKGENGWHHSKAFTLQNFHEPIIMTEKNARILQDSCVSCHEDAIHEMVLGVNGKPDEVRCVHCHVTVGHGETTGLGGPEDYDSVEEGQL